MTDENSPLKLGTADERTTLEGFLDDYRRTVVRKVTGLSEQGARRELVSSESTPGGIIKHLRWVEMSWFQRRFAQRPAGELPDDPSSEADPDGDFRLDADETLDDVIARYQRECELSRKVAADCSLDYAVPHPWLGTVSLRWIYVHMIEETARHAGHIDILREQIDGVTGD